MVLVSAGHLLRLMDRLMKAKARYTFIDFDEEGREKKGETAVQKGSAAVKVHTWLRE